MSKRKVPFNSIVDPILKTLGSKENLSDADRIQLINILGHYKKISDSDFFKKSEDNRLKLEAQNSSLRNFVNRYKSIAYNLFWGYGNMAQNWQDLSDIIDKT